jgi:hypothetical protein
MPSQLKAVVPGTGYHPLYMTMPSPRPPKAMSAASAELRSTFALFAELPAELQLRIWFISLLGPRIIEVQIKKRARRKKKKAKCAPATTQEQLP